MKPLATLSEKQFLWLLALLAATPAFSTDMYLVAIPQIAAGWQVSESRVYLTLIFWFISFSTCMLVWGSISDRYGRRPVLIAGLLLFGSASLLCMLSQSVEQLILFRIVQGAGAAAPSSMVMAVARDLYSGAQRRRILGLMTVILSVAPMIAPTLGATLMNLGSWRWIFGFLGLLSLLSMGLSWRFLAETIQERDERSLLKVASRYRFLFQNVPYMLAVISMCLILMPLYAFIAFAATAYIVHFGLSEYLFGLLFAANALAHMLGSYSASRLGRLLDTRRAMRLAIVGSLLAGSALLLGNGSQGPLVFAAQMAVVAYSCGLTRPVASSMVLEQVQRDIGAASSFMVFCQFMVGACAMALVARPWQQPFVAFALLVVVATLLGGCCWALLVRRRTTRMPD